MLLVLPCVNCEAHNCGLTFNISMVTDESREQLCEIVFDEEFLGGISLRCSPNRAYHLPSSCLINLTYGKRLEANRGGMDLPDSGPRGVASHRESPAAGHRGRGYGGREDQGRVGSPRVGTSSPGNSSQGQDSSERSVWASKVKGQSSSAGKVVKTKKHEAESYSQPRTLLQRQDKR